MLNVGAMNWRQDVAPPLGACVKGGNVQPAMAAMTQKMGVSAPEIVHHLPARQRQHTKAD